MRKLRCKICLLLSLFFAASIEAQEALPVDSLHYLFLHAKSQSEKWAHLKAIAKHYEKLNTDSALIYSDKLVRFSADELPEKLPEAYLLHGWNCRLALEFEEGLAAHFKALELAEEAGRKELLPEIYLNLGQLEEGRKDFKKAKQYLHQSLSLAGKQQDSLTIMKAYNALGNVSRELEQADSTMFFYHKSLELAEGWGKDYYILRAVNNIGTHYHVVGDLEKAIPYYQRAADLALKTGELTSRVFPILNIGHAYLALEEPELAIPYLLEAKQLGEEAGVKMGVGSAVMGLADCYEKLGDFEKAYAYEGEYSQFAIEVTESRYNDQIAEMQTRFETQEKEAQLAQKDLELTRQENFSQRLLIIAAALLLGLVGLFQYFRYRQKLRRQEAELSLQMEKDKAQHLEELGRAKSNFFANISHEFRTPLTLILGPLKKAMEQLPASDADQTSKFSKDLEVSLPTRHVNMMRRNAERLGQLIDQLLDLSKLENGSMKLQVAEGDVVQFVRAMVFSFESLAERRQIHFQTEFSEAGQLAYFDKDKLEKIIVNLLSNAFKYTPEEGRVSVETVLENGCLKISVEDSGPGIPKADLDKIFERFYSLPPTPSKGVEGQRSSPFGGGREGAGTGIGLSLVKELVELHRGQISVESEQGRGTVFEVSLPVAKEVFSENEINVLAYAEKEKTELASAIFTTAETENDDNQQSTTNHEHPLLLIVEDNPDLRRFIAETMEDEYQILTAENGKMGWEKALEHTPDLIVSDVMMPEMNGFEMCEKLKKDERTSHIPIILLTAKAGQPHKVEGLETGADAYLTKPFDEKELLVRGRNLVEQRRKLREHFRKLTTLKPSEVAVTSADERFLQKVTAVIEKNMGNEFFSVEDFAKAVAFSRSQLHRKLKALTGKSPNELIREFRLTRAKELLEKGQGNVSEVAMEVGYNSLSYFTRSFKNSFGISPSEV